MKSTASRGASATKSEAAQAEGKEDIRREAEALAERLKALRERFGKTQVEFAEAIGVSRTALSEMESGRSKPSTTMLIGTAYAFPEVDRDWLISGRGRMTIYDTDGTENLPWSGRLRLYAPATFSDMDMEAARCAFRCLEIVLTKAPERRSRDEDRKIVIDLYARYIGAVQEASSAGAVKTDPRAYAETDCLIYAEKLARYDWTTKEPEANGKRVGPADT